MPFGYNCEFATFDACVTHFTGKGYSAEESRRICGALQRDTESKCAERAEAENQNEETKLNRKLGAS